MTKRALDVIDLTAESESLEVRAACVTASARLRFAHASLRTHARRRAPRTRLRCRRMREPWRLAKQTALAWYAPPRAAAWANQADSCRRNRVCV